MAGKIILVNGASSSGKSTLCRACKARLPLPFWHFFIDHLRDAGILPLERFVRGDFWWADQRTAFFDDFPNCLPVLAQAGNHLVVDHIVETEAWMRRLVELLVPFDVFFVGVHCALPELERREQARGDRRIGSAREDFCNVHRFATYDCEVDGTRPVEANVADVIAKWEKRERPSAFDGIASHFVQYP